MKLVYSKGGKFCCSTFIGPRENALANGYVEVSDGDYKALCQKEKCWENGALVPYEKTAEDISKETRKANRQKIDAIKAKLQDTDYQAIKYAEGYLSLVEFAPIREQRQAWRDEINRLEEELES